MDYQRIDVPDCRLELLHIPLQYHHEADSLEDMHCDWMDDVGHAVLVCSYCGGIMFYG